jgi:hypothetical protein
MQLRRLALHGLLVVAVGVVLLDMTHPGAAVRVLGGLLTDPAHRLRDAHVFLRTGAIAAVVAWAFGRFGVIALAATPLLIGPLFVAHLPPVTGDEPHYLMIAISLDHDHDFAVHNNYVQGDSRAFGYPSLDESPGHPVNSPQSLHYPGTAVLALPGWVLGGRRWALFAMALSGMLLIREMWLLCRALGIRAGPASLAVAMVTFTPPVLLLMRQLFPDIPVGLCLAHLARRLAEAESRTAPARNAPAGATTEPARSRWPFLAPLTVAAVAAAGPWIHVRLLPGLVIFLAALAWRDRRMRILPPAALIGTLGLMAVAFQHWYGSPLPTAPYRNFPVHNPRPFAGLVGMFADSHAGLVLVAPVVVVALVALPALWRAAPVWFAAAGAVVGLAIAQNSAFLFWHAGYSTPARPWTALLPLCVPLVALAVERIPRVMAVAGGWTALVAVTLLALPPLSYPALNGLTGLWDHFHLTFLPVIDNEGRAAHILRTPPADAGLALILTAATLALVARYRFAAPAAPGDTWDRRTESPSSSPA